MKISSNKNLKLLLLAFSSLDYDIFYFGFQFFVVIALVVLITGDEVIEKDDDYLGCRFFHFFLELNTHEHRIWFLIIEKIK